MKRKYVVVKKGYYFNIKKINVNEKQESLEKFKDV